MNVYTIWHNFTLHSTDRYFYILEYRDGSIFNRKLHFQFVTPSVGEEAARILPFPCDGIYLPDDLHTEDSLKSAALPRRGSLSSEELPGEVKGIMHSYLSTPSMPHRLAAVVTIL